MSLPRKRDARLVEVLRALPDVPESARREPAHVLERAELHGLAGVVRDALRAAGVVLPSRLDRELDLREMARDVDHAAHLGLLARIDRALADADISAVVLKGAAFAARYYPRPSARATSDVDLLVAEADLDAAGAALARIGYIAAEGPEEERFRREHHHLHFSHPDALPLELHFHAYRGFGQVLPSEPLVLRRRPFAQLAAGAVGVLAPEDELVFLAVHAAAHRFERLGWLYDLQLLVRTMSEAQIRTAAALATEWGYSRALSFTANLLADVLGERAPQLSVLVGRLGSVRQPVVRGVAGEPAAALARSATRFVYTAALCDTLPAAARYAWSASLARARHALRPVT